MLLVCQWHVQLKHCKCISVFCVLALPGSGCLGGLLAAAMAYEHPAFPNPAPGEAEDAQLDEDVDEWLIAMSLQE